MKPDKSKKKREELTSSLKVIGRIIKDTKPILPSLILAAVISLLSIILSMLAPELIGTLTDGIYDYVTLGAPMDLSRTARISIILIVSYLASGILSMITMIIMNNTVSRHYTCRIRVDMSAKISKIPIKKVDTTPNGEIISRMTNDVSIMGGSVHDIFNIIINGVLKLIVITVLIFISDPIMASVIILFVPASIFLSAKLAARSEKYFDLSREAAGKIYSATEENLTGFDTVKVYNLERHRQDGYEKLSEDYRVKSERGYLTSGVVQPIVAIVNNLAYIAICIVGSILVIRGTLRVGDLMAFILYTQLFSGPLESISGGMSMMQSTIASARRVYEFLDSEEMKEPERKELDEPCLGAVKFENVAFSYTEDKPLIKSLDLDVLPGQKIAIVGPTGGGKTTIVNLLMRFYDPDSGTISVDGRCIQEMNRSDVREMFSMVLQDTVLFSGTVYDNIAYGNPSATEGEVREAARRAHIDFWIDGLPDGYNTRINEESTNISGGQKQLLTIARAYLSDRPILILDEATSNVDTRTELIIQQTMDELMKGRTTFVIAHRLSTVENADVILVVSNGDVVEKGTHRELLASGGLYSEIYNSQYTIVK
ncbi:MAG: ABC transporter ATP-binding protein [Clostridia bacterium]|nr:ABC transporter ATP-binding protein [Clostridia bacterium]